MRRFALLGLMALSACQSPADLARLPPDAVQAGGADPDRAVILSTSHAFSSPAPLSGRPAEAARAVANLEYLATSLPTDPRYTQMNPTVGRALALGRAEARGALGIDPGAPTQPVIDGLYAASRALSARDQSAAAAALAAPPFAPGTLTRLAALPNLPRANEAGVLAAAELWRLQSEGRETGGGGDGGAHP